MGNSPLGPSRPRIEQRHLYSAVDFSDLGNLTRCKGQARLPTQAKGSACAVAAHVRSADARIGTQAPQQTQEAIAPRLCAQLKPELG